MDFHPPITAPGILIYKTKVEMNEVAAFGPVSRSRVNGYRSSLDGVVAIPSHDSADELMYLKYGEAVHVESWPQPFRLMQGDYLTISVVCWRGGTSQMTAWIWYTAIPVGGQTRAMSQSTSRVKNSQNIQ